MKKLIDCLNEESKERGFKNFQHATDNGKVYVIEDIIKYASDTFISSQTTDINQINKLRDICFNASRNAGWHTDIESGKEYTKEQQEERFPLKLVLVHSELSEALEGVRKSLMDDHLPHRKMGEVELSDAVIRIMDLAGSMGYDIGGAIVEKLEYNKQRSDHKIENRLKSGGKKF